MLARDVLLAAATAQLIRLSCVGVTGGVQGRSARGVGVVCRGAGGLLGVGGEGAGVGAEVAALVERFAGEGVGGYDARVLVLGVGLGFWVGCYLGFLLDCGWWKGGGWW